MTFSNEDLALTFIGVIAPFLFTVLFFSIRYISEKIKENISGEWFVFSYSGDDKTGWVKHKIRVKTALRGGFYFSMIEEIAGYHYEGWGRVKNNYFFGTWLSKSPRSKTTGTFSCLIEPRGRYFVGYYLGPSSEHHLIFHPWIICREESLYQDALSLLKLTSRKVSNRPTL